MAFATENETLLFWRLQIKEHSLNIHELVIVLTCLENRKEIEVTVSAALP